MTGDGNDLPLQFPGDQGEQLGPGAVHEEMVAWHELESTAIGRFHRPRLELRGCDPAIVHPAEHRDRARQLGLSPVLVVLDERADALAAWFEDFYRRPKVELPIRASDTLAELRAEDEI